MICDEFWYTKGLCVYAKRNPSFVSELLTYEVVKEDAPDIEMLAQNKPVIFVHEISKEKYNYHEWRCVEEKIQTRGFCHLIQVTIYFDDFISSTSGNYHEPPNDFCEEIETKSEPTNCSD